MIRVPPHLGTMFHDVPVPRFGTKFPERGTCPCFRIPAAKVVLPGLVILVKLLQFLLLYLYGCTPSENWRTIRLNLFAESVSYLAVFFFYNKRVFSFSESKMPTTKC